MLMTALMIWWKVDAWRSTHDARLVANQLRPEKTSLDGKSGCYRCDSLMDDTCDCLSHPDGAQPNLSRRVSLAANCPRATNMSE